MGPAQLEPAGQWLLTAPCSLSIVALFAQNANHCNVNISRLLGEIENQVAHLRNEATKQIQIRMNEGEVDALCADYTSGTTVDRLAATYGIHRTTVMRHLKRRDVETRRSRRKLTDSQVDQAAIQYSLGDSLADIAAEYGVDAETLRREFKRIGLARRPRNGD